MSEDDETHKEVSRARLEIAKKPFGTYAVLSLWVTSRGSSREPLDPDLVVHLPPAQAIDLGQNLIEHAQQIQKRKGPHPQDRYPH